MNRPKFKQTEIGEIPEDWDVQKVKDIGKVVTGKTPPTKENKYFGTNYPFVKIPDMGISVRVESTETMLSYEGAQYMRSLKLPPDSVMVSCLATIGKVGITAKESFTNQQINTIIPNVNKVIPGWIYYFFKNNTEYLESLGGGGSVYTNISKSRFENAHVVVPPLSEQCAIAKILYDLDEKIELNHQINKTLESIAQAIFKRWFVDFEFPRHEKIKFVKGLPEGWRQVALGEIVKIESGKRPGEKSETKTQDFAVSLIGASSVMGFVKDALYKEPILIIGRVGTHGIVQRVSWPSFPSDNTLIIRSKYFEFVYQVLKTIDYKALNVGTTQPLITQTSIKNYTILLPNVDVLNAFENSISGLFKKIAANDRENESLIMIRDSLLPRLMSGKIRIYG